MSSLREQLAYAIAEGDELATADSQAWLELQTWSIDNPNWVKKREGNEAEEDESTNMVLLS